MRITEWGYLSTVSIASIIALTVTLIIASTVAQLKLVGLRCTGSVLLGCYNAEVNQIKHSDSVQGRRLGEKQ